MSYPKIIAKEITEYGASYRIQWPCGMKLWFDLQPPDEYGDITGDWNKYIFHTQDHPLMPNVDASQEMKEKAFQEDIDNFEEALSLCVAEYEKDTK